MMLDLFHHGSSACAAKVRLALAEKALSWKGHYVDILRGEQFRPEFIKINPKAVVPVLIHDGYIVPESTVICEYIEEIFPDRPIYPRDARLRAEVRLWTKSVDEELHPACSAITYIVSHRHTVLRNGVGSFEQFIAAAGAEGLAARTLKWRWITEGLSAPGAAEKIHLYDSYLKKMEASLEGREWLVGGAFSMADIALAPYVNRLNALEMHGLWSGGRLPRVERWFAAIRSRPSFGPAFMQWMPVQLSQEMRENGKKTWPEIKSLLGV